MGRNQINWRLYNKALIDRGNITFWFPTDAGRFWYNERLSGKRGASNTYTQAAVDILSLVRFKFRLTLRETQGFCQALATLMNLDLQIPNYSTLCRRLKSASNRISQYFPKRLQHLHVVVDSTGLKVFGEGEWKVRQHGYSKRRTWMKLHLGVDESNSQILAVFLTDNSFKDSEVFEDLLAQVDAPIEQASGDGAYDSNNCYDYAISRKIRGVFPPRSGARIKIHGNRNGVPHPRDEHVRQIRKKGRKQWKIQSGYSRRSLAETAMYRFKALLGEKLASRGIYNQAAEVVAKCKILNRMLTPAAL